MVDRFAFDARWRYAAGVGGYDGDGWATFAHTVLVDMRARLAASKDPHRLFEVTLQAASKAGLVRQQGHLLQTLRRGCPLTPPTTSTGSQSGPVTIGWSFLIFHTNLLSPRWGGRSFEQIQHGQVSFPPSLSAVLSSGQMVWIASHPADDVDSFLVVIALNR